MAVRLAQAGVAQEQTAAWRQSEAETARERAAAYEGSATPWPEQNWRSVRSFFIDSDSCSVYE